MPESPVPEAARDAFLEVGLSGCTNHMAPQIEVSDEAREALTVRIEMFKARMSISRLDRPTPVPDSGIGPQRDPRG